MQSDPVTTDIVLVGGGHAHVEVLRRFGMRPEPGVRLTVISREVLTPYSGMLPGLIAGHYTHDEAHIDLAPLARFANARLYHDEVVGLDPMSQQVMCRSRPAVSYDFLSIDTGSSPDLSITGAAVHGIAVKPVSRFFMHWQNLCERLQQASEPVTVGVVGGGAGGVELIMSLHHATGKTLGGSASLARFCLITSSDRILPGHNSRVRTRYHAALAAAGVEVVTGFEVVEAKSDCVLDRQGKAIALDEVLWVTTASAPAWPREAGLTTDPAGFIRVSDTLQTATFPEIFAAGDIAAVDRYPRPKSGVFAVRQGPALADNLRRMTRGQVPKPYRPQRQFLSLISTGGKHAIASRGPFSASGDWVWRWKDWIDRRFMERYRELPEMTDESAGSIDDDDLLAAMRCGGCGSKIGAEILHEALHELAPAAREDVVIGLQQADDAAVVRVPQGHVAVHTVDAFRSFLDDPYLLGQVAAVHGLSDIYAMGATPQTALAIVTLELAKASRMRDDLVQLMRGALRIFEQDNTLLVGGHTGEGSELALGFALNGHVDADQLIRKRGVKPGDRLILTQALGSGILFAAHMRGKARAPWVDEALEAMSTSKGQAARILCNSRPHAMTDITGFGLVGHLREMIDDEQVDIEISLDSLPVYAGVESLSEQGILSSLQPENRRAERFVETDSTKQRSPRYEIAFDPQTAGGLLAAVPADRADNCVSELRARGYLSSCVIGEAGAGSGRIRLR